jgi:hypothetical protein
VDGQASRATQIVCSHRNEYRGGSKKYISIDCNSIQAMIYPQIPNKGPGLLSRALIHRSSTEAPDLTIMPAIGQMRRDGNKYLKYVSRRP